MEQLLTFCAGTDAGSLEGTAAFSPDCGVLRIRAALPAGILTDARAELPWAMWGDGKALHERLPDLDPLPGAGKAG